MNVDPKITEQAMRDACQRDKEAVERLAAEYGFTAAQTRSLMVIAVALIRLVHTYASRCVGMTSLEAMHVVASYLELSVRGAIASTATFDPDALLAAVDRIVKPEGGHD